MKKKPSRLAKKRNPNRPFFTEIAAECRRHHRGRSRVSPPPGSISSAPEHRKFQAGFTHEMENKVVNEELARLGLEEEKMQSDGAKSKDNKSMTTCYSSWYTVMPTSYSLRYTEMEADICPCRHARSAMSGPEMEEEMKKQFEIDNQRLCMLAVARCNISEEEEEEEEDEEDEEESEEEQAIFKLATKEKETACSLLELFMRTRKREARLAKKNCKDGKLSQNSDMFPEIKSLARHTFR